ncbi:unnamed protein product [Staurois parvus]|uniref:Uncharacterized protein n=1 Tax=Staurois parvus TaxID=386267 RepID=A0ABN9H6I1_9NEOB|nr:unnamed protein product [Staurois parvus]
MTGHYSSSSSSPKPSSSSFPLPTPPPPHPIHHRQQLHYHSRPASQSPWRHS